MTLWAVGATAVAAVASALPASALLLLSKGTRRRVVPWLVAFAAGALLAAALVDLLPEALAAGASPRSAGATVLAGLLVFFVVDVALSHRHGHGEDDDEPEGAAGSAGPLVLVGDALHNFVDGVAIAAAFTAGVPAGIGTAVAVLAHEVPQEVGNVALLIESGWAPRRAFLANLAVQLLGVLGALLATMVVDAARAATPYVLAVACASFLYVSVADLIPSLQRGPRGRRAGQGAMLFAGAGAIAAVHLALG